MVTLRRIGVFSAARVGFLFAAATTLVNIAFVLFWFIVVQGAPIEIIFSAELWFAIAMNVTISSTVMAMGVGMFAFIYNMGMGGLQLEFDTPEVTTKRKNDEFIDIDEEIE